MKRTRIAAMLYYLVAGLIDLSALVVIFRSHNTNIGVLLLCIGSAMLCFGGAFANRYEKEQQDEEHDHEESK